MYPNVARFIAFGIAFILVIVLLIVTSEKIDDIKDERRKNKLIQVFKEYDTDKISEKDDFFFDYYLSRGSEFIKHLYELMSDQEKLNNLAQGKERSRKRGRERFLFSDDATLFNELLSEGFIVIENDVVTVDPARYSVLTDFFNYLKRKGEFRRKRDVYIRHQEMILEMKEHNKLLKPDADKTGAA